MTGFAATDAMIVSWPSIFPKCPLKFILPNEQTWFIMEMSLLNNPERAARAKTQNDSKTELSRLGGLARNNFSDVSKD